MPTPDTSTRAQHQTQESNHRLTTPPAPTALANPPSTHYLNSSHTASAAAATAAISVRPLQLWVLLHLLHNAQVLPSVLRCPALKPTSHLVNHLQTHTHTCVTWQTHMPHRIAQTGGGVEADQHASRTTSPIGCEAGHVVSCMQGCELQIDHLRLNWPKSCLRIRNVTASPSSLQPPTTLPQPPLPPHTLKSL